MIIGHWEWLRSQEQWGRGNSIWSGRLPGAVGDAPYRDVPFLRVFPCAED